ncbi:MAG: DNA topoisomerase family protein, partial [Candidatus Acidiferrales bacterium]
IDSDDSTPESETQYCDNCSREMVIKRGRFGVFYACSGYPDCTNTREPELEVRGIDSDDTTPESETQYCDNCGREMVIKRGRFGPFYACSGYPDCKTTKPLAARGRAAEPVPLNENCPECGGQLVEKHGRFGVFIACSNFPECRYTRQKTLGIKCPECGQGELSERHARKGKRIFYGCSRYPECKFTVGHRPVAEPCPKCKAAITYEKRAPKHQGGGSRYCRAEGCDFEVPLTDSDKLVEATPS